MRSPAVICAVTVVELTYLVTSDKPFHSATIPLAKPIPAIVTFTDGLPAGAEDGFTDVIEGPATAGVMVKVLAFD